MKIWLDDIRSPPDGWIHVKTVEQTIHLLWSRKVTHISLDHDLGNDINNGYDVSKWIEEAAFFGVIPRIKWNIHSDNPVGIMNMRIALNNADRYWRRYERNS